MSRIHIYQAKIVEVVDGDTFDLMIDLGFNNFTKQRMRLYGIDAPEMRTQAGKDLAWNLSMQYPGSLPVIVQSVEVPRASNFATSTGGFWRSFTMFGRLHPDRSPMAKRS
jgi:hypothetical protein